ncbi:hypothetical protein UFOVP1362_26 [uncultured Caudovirales phage]|uniref:Uncharacterized protein n=1 Tax=uncultured Caudovirales phage TaxID=2100421 RepID=A0A6J5QTS3_9CAUD|nr:hypothetical protein UFOVP1101_56 [uncultured Caudovirales phage]CAB4201971.1 hypothetical protein UFOVP1362_26 [uncultured Caudovirales phage]
MSNIAVFSQAGLPSVQSLSTALRKLESDVGPAGTVILKMDKTGHWVFGADQTEIEDGSVWAVNPFSFVHGSIAWGDGEVLGEKMVSVSQPLPELDVAPPGAKKGWETQVGLSLKCMSGEDKGMEARFSSTSVGGKRAVQTLALAIAEQVEKDPTKPVPLVGLLVEHYQHKSYGKIFTPVFSIDEWMSLDAEAEAPAPAPVVEEPAPAPAGRRRRAVA